MNQKDKGIEAKSLKHIKDRLYKFEDSSLWFFKGETIISNTAEIFKVKELEAPGELGDFYTIEAEQGITPANIKRIKYFKLK